MEVCTDLPLCTPTGAAGGCLRDQKGSQGREHFARWLLPHSRLRAQEGVCTWAPGHQPGGAEGMAGRLEKGQAEL